MTPPGPAVAAIVVTYGQRWHYLEQVLAELRRHHPSLRDIVIVDNASAGFQLSDLAGGSTPRIHVVRLDDNMGSAAGFKTGIELARHRTDADLYWLLDDDNLPEQDSLAQLLSAFDALGGDAVNAVLSLRPNRREYVEAALGERVVQIQLNSFMGLHLNKIANRLGVRRPPARPMGDGSMVPVGHAPYGGLLFHKRWVDRIGLPNEDYYIYADDFEFTSRIVQAGGRILLCPASRVRDLETSWHLTQGRRFHWMATDLDSDRVYYSMRNRVHLERSRFVSSTATYVANAATFVVLRLALGAVYHVLIERRPGRVWERFRLLQRAIRDGWSGRLGRVDFSTH